jgi:hypothetical protein
LNCVKTLGFFATSGLTKGIEALFVEALDIGRVDLGHLRRQHGVEIAPVRELAAAELAQQPAGNAR